MVSEALAEVRHCFLLQFKVEVQNWDAVMLSLPCDLSVLPDVHLLEEVTFISALAVGREASSGCWPSPSRCCDGYFSGFGSGSFVFVLRVRAYQVRALTTHGNRPGNGISFPNESERRP